MNQINFSERVRLKTLQEQLKMSKPFRLLEEEVFLNLKVTLYGLSSQCEELFDEVGLTEVTYNIMRILRGAGEKGLPCSEISNRMLARVPDVTRLIDRLVKLEYVERGKLEGDRRVVLQHLTPKGQKVLEGLDDKLAVIHRENFSGLSKVELIRLNELVNVLREKFNEKGVKK